jgi:tripartite-type tricarboxylate transporter receptor subunit TctC
MGMEIVFRASWSLVGLRQEFCDSGSEHVTVLKILLLVFAAKSTLPANDLNEFVFWLKTNGGTALQGIAQIGDPAQVAGVLLQSAIGVRWQMVPYRGSAPMMQDLVAGQLDWAIAVPESACRCWR